MSDDNKKKPYETLQDADLVTSLWRQSGKFGDYLNSSGVEKVYQDEGGNFKRTRSLSGVGEHLRASRLSKQAADRIAEFRDEMKAQRSQGRDMEQ